MPLFNFPSLFYFRLPTLKIKINSNYNYINHKEQKLQPFIIFNTIHVNFYGSKKITRKCHHTEKILKQLGSSNLLKSSEIEFFASTMSSEYQFNTCNQLFNYINDNFIPLFGSCSKFHFGICLNSDVDNGIEFIKSMLNVHKIIQCPNVSLSVHCKKNLSICSESVINWIYAHKHLETKKLEIHVSCLDKYEELFNQFSSVILAYNFLLIFC